MMFTTFDKANITVVAGAITAILAQFVSVNPEVTAAFQTLLTAAMVWRIPNRHKGLS